MSSMYDAKNWTKDKKKSADDEENKELEDLKLNNHKIEINYNYIQDRSGPHLNFIL